MTEPELPARCRRGSRGLARRKTFAYGSFHGPRSVETLVDGEPEPRALMSTPLMSASKGQFTASHSFLDHFRTDILPAPYYRASRAELATSGLGARTELHPAHQGVVNYQARPRPHGSRHGRGQVEARMIR